MRKYARLLGSYAGILITAMVLYLPWLVGLTPSDPSILRAGLSVICGIVLTGAFGASTYAYLHEPEYPLLETSEVLEADDVIWRLQDLSHLPLVGHFAQDSIGQVETMDHRCERLERLLSSKFDQESFTYEKFMDVVRAAHLTLLRNCALLANRVQSFDVDGYKKTGRRLHAAGQVDELGAEQLGIYEQALTDMREIGEANERLLLEMGKLEMEVSDFDGDDAREGNDRTLEEVGQLLEQMKYYK